jgi:hypothetical protein
MLSIIVSHHLQCSEEGSSLEQQAGGESHHNDHMVGPLKNEAAGFEFHSEGGFKSVVLGFTWD